MKKEARYKLNAKSQKSGFLTTAKISRIFKTDFLTIYHTSASFFFHPKASVNRYTFLSISVHFHYHLSPPLSILNEQLFLAKCSFDHKLRFPRSLLYLETSYHLTFIQTYQFAQAISVTKIELFSKKAFIMNSILRFTLQGEVINLKTVIGITAAAAEGGIQCL